MKPEMAKAEFRRFLRERALDVAHLSPRQGVLAMIAFYAEERAEGCSAASEDDMLLYQWGVYRWTTEEFFELNITRQLCLDGGEDEDIWQLGLTFKFAPTDAVRGVQRGDRWGGSLDELDEFKKYILASEALQVVEDLAPVAVELGYECAG